uniref:Serine/threonine-protein phosphatase n=1 Tax=Hanusia phi TaxID=3032 RepID=A0A7S0EFJ3_9CRYP|mmetsp:Transcript_23475/g.52768  ORF Transcript_23475/g.52768 Transcript_23475/m.52768 type:complete len:796 (+) Transcript_23475:154-2541(+)
MSTSENARASPSQSSHGKRHDVPFVKANGVDLSMFDVENVSEGLWSMSCEGPLKLFSLEIGLRKLLREQVADAGGKVRAEVRKRTFSLDGLDAVLESFYLETGNNFRCTWIGLEDNPLHLDQGLEVSFVKESCEDGEALGPDTHGKFLSSTNGANGETVGEAKNVKGALETIEESNAENGDSSEHASKKDNGQGDGTRVAKRPRTATEVPIFAKDDPPEKSRETFKESPSEFSNKGKGKGLISVHVPPYNSFTRPQSGGGTPLHSPSLRPCPSPLGVRTTSWKLASHTVMLNRYQGTVEDFELLWRKDSTSFPLHDELMSGISSAPHTPRSFLPDTPSGNSNAGWNSPLESPRSTRSESPTANGDKFGRSVSSVYVRRAEILSFDLDSAPNQVVEALRFFEMPIPEKNKRAFDWGRQPVEQMTALARYIETVAKDVRKLCLAEPRCVHVKAPCYILGDIHGNFPDLVAFEKALWRIGPNLSPANFLMLGDYVDRGAHSVEVVAYLFAQKMMCPSKFKLLRGNHETRIQNSHSGYNPCFRDSCEKLFGKEIGESVWEAVNSVFDALPLAAIVDHNIFCVHGGIPSPSVLRKHGEYGSASLIAEINKIPRDLPQPDPSVGGDALAWDLMWNDPAPSNFHTPQDSSWSEGFGPNFSRGTAHMFTAEALEQFLRRYNFSHLVRAHEVRKTGFQIQQHAKMVTLFSSSGYCGSNNEACCILACEGKIRFIRLEHTRIRRPLQNSSLATRAAAACSALVHSVNETTQTEKPPPPQAAQSTAKPKDGDSDDDDDDDDDDADD